MRIPIPSKAGKGRSPQLSPELLVNMYAEKAPDNSVASFVVHGVPGFKLFATIGNGEIRGMYRALGNGVLYVVMDNALFTVSSSGVVSDSLGEIVSSGRVFFSESPNEICIIAGAKGYTYNATEGLELISDGDFPGASSVTYMDGYFIFSNRQSGQKDQFFISNLLDGQTYDALDFATAERYPDNLVRVYADHSNLLLFGTVSIEVWFNAGNADFPFARAQGSVIDQGLGAAHTVEKVDESVIWLDNEGMVRRLEGGVPVRISTHAIEYLISLGDWTNAYSYSYTMEGHQFYVLTVPAANTSQTAGTYVCDAATKLWHQRKSYELDYSRIGFYANAFGKHIVGDVITGKLYEYSLDICQENGDHLIAEMHFPQIYNNGNRFIVHEFRLDADVGNSTDIISTQLVPGDWAAVTSGVATGINDVYASGTTVVAVGDSGVILLSSDSGATWAAAASPGFGSSNINSVVKIDSTWYAAADDSKIGSSSDGDSWTVTDVSGSVVYDSVSMDITIGAHISTDKKWRFSSDRTKIYILDDEGINEYIEQWNLSTAGDITTATWSQKSGDIGNGTTGFWVHENKLFTLRAGSILYEFSGISSGNVSAVALPADDTYSTAGDLGSGSVYDLCMNSAGTRMFVTEGAGLAVHQYNLSGSLSTISYANKSGSISEAVSGVIGIAFAESAKKIYISNDTATTRQYALTNALDISTLSYEGSYTSTESGNGQAVDFNSDGTKLFVYDDADNAVYQYSVSPEYNITEPAPNFTGIAGNSSKRLAVGNAGFYIDVTTAATPIFYQYGSNNLLTIGITNTSKWLIAGESGTMAISGDGINFIAVTSSFGSDHIYGINFGLGQWMASGANEKIANSVKGVGWTQETSPFSASETVFDVDSNDDLFYVVSSAGDAAYSYGESWTVQDAAFSDGQINGVTVESTYAVAVGESGKISRSVLTETATITKVDEPMVMLRESPDTRTTGLTEPTVSYGKQGEYSKQIIWRRRGQYDSYTPIVRISSPVKRAIFAAYAEVEPCDG